MNLKSFSNLPQWVSKLDDEVEKKLANRLTNAINSWIDVFVKKNATEDMNNTTGTSKRGLFKTALSQAADGDDDISTTGSLSGVGGDKLLKEPNIKKITNDKKENKKWRY